MNFILKFIPFFLIILLLIPAASGDTTIQVQGFNRITPIVREAASSYMAQNPGVSITVTDADSAVALQALVQGKNDIALGRDLEKLSLEDPALYSQLPSNVDGRAVLVIIVNPQNPVSHLSIDQIQKIYRGEIKNWAEVGGNNAPITTVGLTQYKDESKGVRFWARRVFDETVMSSPEAYPIDKELDSDSHVLQEVASDEDSIGYADYQYFDPEMGGKTTTVKTLGLDIGNSVINLTPEMVTSGNYPFYENLVIYTRETPSDSTQKFIRYLLSPAGQYFVQSAGDVPVSNVSMPALAFHEISGPDTIKTPGYYRLTNDLNGCCSSASCIAITSSDVILDGMGHSVQGCSDENSPTMFGISVGTRDRHISNILVENLSVSVVKVGINIFSVNDSSVINSHISGGTEGISSGESNRIEISKNVVSSSAGSGIFSFDSNSIDIHNNFLPDDWYGISLVRDLNGSSNRYAILQDNRIDHSHYHGIAVSGYDYSVISGNTIAFSDQYALYLTTVNNSVIANNSLYKNSNDLSCTTCGNNNTFANNTELASPPGNVPISTIIVGTTTAVGFAAIIIYLGQIPLPTLVGTPLGEVGFLKFIVLLKIKADDFMHHPVIIPFLASAALGVAFLFEEQSVENPLVLLIVFTILGGVVVVSRWIVIYFLAKRSGLDAEIRFWWVGAFTVIMTGLLFRNAVGTPVHTHVHEDVAKQDIGPILLVGPGLSGFFSLIFMTLFFSTSDTMMHEIFLKGIYLSLMIAFVNFLPIYPMDGVYVKKWNQEIWAVIFVVLFACLVIPQFIMH